jgi:methylaspartate ammonia-lyase
MEVAREEIFGPVLAVQRFSTESEAVDLANGTEYGLAAGVWTRDLGRGHRVAHRLRAGTVWVNSYRVVAPNVPFGGVGSSGWGRESGLEAVKAYTETKAIWIELDGLNPRPLPDGLISRSASRQETPSMSALRIVDVLTSPARTGFFADDQLAIRAGARQDGFSYTGDPVTPGFTSIRQPGEALSILLILSDGSVATGDAASVQYAGAGGREGAFRADRAAVDVATHVAPVLLHQEVGSFRELSARTDAIRPDGVPLPVALRYGLSQALLDAVATSQRVTMAEVIRDEFATGVELRPVPLFVQSGDDRYTAVDKMILKGAGSLPHGLINQVGKLGESGELLADYVVWVRDRVLRLRSGPDYDPILHIDAYGTIGMIFAADTERMAGYLARLGALAAPFRLRVEHPVDAGNRDGQVMALTALRDALRRLGADVQIVADEWCNTLQDIEVFVSAQAADVIHVKTPDLGGLDATAAALLLVRRSGLAAYCGGTCNETDRSAQVSAHVAMACGADLILAKPGMGVDEGMMIVGNEMERTAVLAARRSAGAPLAGRVGS